MEKKKTEEIVQKVCRFTSGSFHQQKFQNWRHFLIEGLETISNGNRLTSLNL